MPVQCTCPVCGGTFDVKPSHVNERRFCSTECRRVGGWRSRPSLIDRFWPRVDKNSPIVRPEFGPCWLWTGPTVDGYGRISTVLLDDHKRVSKAHAVAWEFASGDRVPDDQMVLHVCDVRRCVRNDEAGTYAVDGVLLPRWGHLFLGTALENARDMMAKGRNARAEATRHVGVLNGQSKLNDQAIVEIRALAGAGMTKRAIGRQYGVSEVLVGKIVRREAWRHVP